MYFSESLIYFFLVFFKDFVYCILSDKCGAQGHECVSHAASPSLEKVQVGPVLSQ